jgi:hypothetical protein
MVLYSSRETRLLPADLAPGEELRIDTRGSRQPKTVGDHNNTNTTTASTRWRCLQEKANFLL